MRTSATCTLINTTSDASVNTKTESFALSNPGNEINDLISFSQLTFFIALMRSSILPCCKFVLNAIISNGISGLEP